MCSLSLICAPLSLNPVRPSYGRGRSGATTARLPKSRFFRTFHARSLHMADADRLTLNLSTGGDVVIKLRPDLAPGHVERITELANSGFYDGVVVPPRDPGLHGPGRRSDRHRDQRLRAAQPQGRILATSRTSAARPRWRARPDPDSANSQFFIVLRRRRLPRRPVHRLGRGRERHGTCRRAARRRAAARAGQDRQGDGVESWR